MPAAVRTPDRWLFGPVPDLLLGCGLLYVLIFAAHAVAGPQLANAQPGWLLPLLIMVLSMPHYGGTLLRVYEQRKDRRAYALFAVHSTFVLVVCFFFAVRNALVASIFLTIYLTWSPWHYTGQNYGLALMFLRRRGVEIDPSVKRWIYASFILSFALTFLVLHSGAAPSYGALDYEGRGVLFLPLGIPHWIGIYLVSAVGGAYLVALAGAGAKLLRRTQASDLLPPASLALLQALWFSGPFAINYFGWGTGLEPLDKSLVVRQYVLWTFVGHGVQYLWVTTYYARATEQWRGYSNYLAKAAAAGVALWTLPFLAAPVGLSSFSADAGLALVVASFVNIHHFILDGAIWKLRNTRIAGILIRSEVSRPEPVTPRGWGSRAVWAVTVLGLAIGIFEFWEYRVAYGSAIRSGDYAKASGVLDRLAWFGYDRAARRIDLGRAFEQAGAFDAAAREYARSVALTPDAIISARLGMVHERAGHPAAAERAYRDALALGGRSAEIIHAAVARLALADGRDAEAAKHLREVVRLAPAANDHRNNLAWLLATTSDPEVRAPEEAIDHARRVLAALEKPDANVLDTLAAGYAAAGRFDEAVSSASRALALAARGGDHALEEQIGGKLALYRAGRPFVAAAATAPPGT